MDTEVFERCLRNWNVLFASFKLLFLRRNTTLKLQQSLVSVTGLQSIHRLFSTGSHHAKRHILTVLSQCLLACFADLILPLWIWVLFIGKGRWKGWGSEKLPTYPSPSPTFFPKRVSKFKEGEDGTFPRNSVIGIFLLDPAPPDRSDAWRIAIFVKRNADFLGWKCEVRYHASTKKHSTDRCSDDKEGKNS